MKWVAFAARMVVGLAFTVFSLNYFVPFLTMPMPDLPKPAQDFMAAIAPTGYLTVVKALELIGGLLLLSGRFAPLALVLLTPVAVNIALWDVCLNGKPALGVVLTALCFALVCYYRRHFASVFAPAAVV
ncbi:hypothetical protein BH11PLA2_BH11PLA2_52040 [soil metagenome]